MLQQLNIQSLEIFLQKTCLLSLIKLLLNWKKSVAEFHQKFSELKIAEFR